MKNAYDENSEFYLATLNGNRDVLVVLLKQKPGMCQFTSYRYTITYLFLVYFRNDSKSKKTFLPVFVICSFSFYGSQDRGCWKLTTSNFQCGDETWWWWWSFQSC